MRGAGEGGGKGGGGGELQPFQAESGGPQGLTHRQTGEGWADWGGCPRVPGTEEAP